jgi:hypothetical protein
MNRDEFRKQLGQLQEILGGGLACYTAWKRLALHDPGRVSWSLQEQNEVLGRFRGFITPVAYALHHTALMEFAKLFDTHGRAVSLTNLLAAARQDASFTPHGDATEISKQLRKSKRIRAQLKLMRDQRLAHVDAAPLPVGPIRNTELDELVDDVKSVFGSLWTAYDGGVVSWDYWLRTADEHTIATLQVLRKEIECVQKRREDEMVRIGLEETRRRQAVLGHRLNTEELRSVGQSFGLTDEEMQLIEEQYGSS